jgi:hypothetical protein
VAKLWTVVSGSTVITSVVITSIARIVHLPTVHHTRDLSGCGAILVTFEPAWQET